MTDNELLDIYSDYLISAFGLTTTTGLAAMLNRQISHDRVQRFLAGKPRTSADLWRVVKPHVRALQRDDGVLILDDSIAEKPYTDENEIVCWHYDHAKDRPVLGINFLTALYHVQEVSLPVGITLIAKTDYYIDKKDGKQKRRSPIGKNAYYRDMIQQAVINQIPFQYVLNDVWFASAENTRFVKQTLQQDFMMPLKANRKVALSYDEKQQGQYVRVDTLNLEPHTLQEVYLEAGDYPHLQVASKAWCGKGSMASSVSVATVCQTAWSPRKRS
jgi:hypothetical protein